ncbi:LytTR family DNA-binding domain-containing protein [Aquimarina macrocephali]|uniref:LytTR family DNA-binding domain-containing protein n=1 Tax=Aquimarina macrocephali TaxID=666563 RepID=UPI000466E8C7|nr:LytTR family DNA-binding domain-containing protein [Aquimarina macrocephali]
MNKLNPSIKHHLFVGLFIGFWIFCFGFFIRPFDDAILDYEWVPISIGFGMFSFLCYAIVAVIQNKLYQKILRWNITFEIITIVCYCLFFTIVLYAYSKSDFVNSAYNFSYFSFLMAKTSIVLIPILILARIYVVKLIPPKETMLTIKGDNKLDILKLYPSDLISVSSSQNYVEIFFLDNNALSSKLIRSSLKKIHQTVPSLIQVHRSHFINPSHFKSWKNQNTIYVTQMEVVVSKNYKEVILTL